MSEPIRKPDENPSRVESILSDTIGLSGYEIEAPRSRIEILLLELEELIKEGGGESSNYGTSLSIEIDNNFVISASLLNKDGEVLGEVQTVDLPLESVVVNGSYDSVNKQVVLTLQNGSAVRFSVADLVDGLQTEITSQNPLDADLIDDSTATHKFATAAQLSQIQINKNNISLLETKVNTNAGILSQTYNSADCNISMYLCQDNGAINDSTYYIADQSKMYFMVRYFGRLLRYWKDGVDYQKYRWLPLGLIATNNSAKKDMLTLDIPEVTNETYVKKISPNDPDDMVLAFIWTKSSVNPGDVWYIRPYARYTDLETGMEYTMYGAVYKVTVGVPCTIECDTLSCTELTQIVGDINSVLEEVL